MKISYRDELGIIVVNVDNTNGIMFLDGHAYFTDTDGRDYKIPVSALVMIG